jgi:predicted RNA-binding Zn-ribbon protein involved in translation (DUF1610 family)
MVNCPKCGKKIDKPTRKIENSYFYLAMYVCDNCGYDFKNIK